MPNGQTQDPEYEKGQTYSFPDGSVMKYLGGPISDSSSWQVMTPRQPSMPPPGLPRPSQMDTTDPRTVGAFQEPGDTYGPGEAAMHAARLATQGATFGLSDEIAGMVYGPEVRDQVRRELGQAREDLGTIPSLLIEGAPMALAPLGAAGAATRAGGGIASAAARGMAAGGAEGMAYGMGQAEGNLGERARQGVIPGLFGAALGGAGAAAVPAMNAARRGPNRNLINRFLREPGSPGARVAQRARSLAPEAAEDWANAAHRLENYRQHISHRYYGPLERQFKEITDPEITNLLTQDADIRRFTQRVSPEVAAGRRPPSFKDLQTIRNQMRAANRPGAAQAGALDATLRRFDNLVHSKVPGWREADQAYRLTSGLAEALETGSKNYNKSGAELELMLEGMNRVEREAFRTGQFHEILRRIEQREESAGSWLRRFMDAGPETERIVRTLFPEPEAQEAFLRAARMERSAENVRRVIRRYAPWLLGAAAAGAGGAAAARFIPQGGG